MRRTLTLSAVVLVVLGTALGRIAQEEADPERTRGPVDWRTDLAAATAEAAEKDRPLLLVFR